MLSVTVLTLWVAPPEMFCNLMEPKPIVELHTFKVAYYSFIRVQEVYTVNVQI